MEQKSCHTLMAGGFKNLLPGKLNKKALSAIAFDRASPINK
jgi:hypothetical protein